MEELQEESKPVYKSREGFETVPLARGFTEIAPLFNLLKEQSGGVICGGYARYAASPNQDPSPSNDVDVYCETEEVFGKLRAALNAVPLIEKHENEMAVTYTRPDLGPWSYMPAVQLIKPVLEGRVVSAGDYQSVLGNFDFSVVRVAIISPTEALADADFLHDETTRLLRLKNIHCPISSTLRCMKYAKKGYWLRPLECLRLFIDWENRTPEYREKLVDFLGKADGGEGLSQEDINELEKLMRID